MKFFSSRKSWTLPYVIFSAFFVVLPLLLVVAYAFTDENGAFSLQNFIKFSHHTEDVNTFIYSIGIAALTTIACILLGYPAAYILAKSKARYANTVIMLFILPRHGGIIRLCRLTARRGGSAVWHDIQLPAVYGLPYLQHIAENGPQLYRGG